MTSFRTTIIILLVTLAFTSSWAENDAVSSYCEKGWIAFNKGNFDSSITYFLTAYSNGMSKDSLIYLWAETYRKRNIQDSALALNYSIKNTANDTGFKKQVLIQRYLIFSALNWNKKAQTIKDSLGIKKHHNIFPEFTFKSAMGYDNSHAIQSTTWPWTEFILPDSLNITKGVKISSDLHLKWNLSFWGKTKSFIETGLNVNKPYYIKDIFKDSLRINKQLSLSGGITNIFDKITVDFTISEEMDYTNSRNISLSSELLYSSMSNDWIQFISSGYMIRKPIKNDIDYRLFWIIGYAGKTYKNSNGINFIISGNYSSQKSLTYTHDDILSVYFIGNTDSSGFIQHYSDTAFKEPIDTLQNENTSKWIITYLGEINNSWQPITLSQLINKKITATIPQDYISLEPAFSYDFNLPNKFKITLGTSCRISYYLEKYEWVELNSEIKNYTYDTNTKLGYTKNENKLYVQEQEAKTKNVFSNKNFSDIQEIYSTNPIDLSFTMKSRRRIDNTVSSSLSIKKDFKNYMALSINGSFDKTWSTLDKNSPIDIPSWSWSVSSDFIFNINHNKKYD